MGKRGPRPKRTTAERVDHPREFVDFGYRRTAGIRRAWGNWGDYSLKMLCASCYLQGLEDAYRALSNQGEA